MKLVKNQSRQIDNNIKIVIVGDTTVGKTKLIRYYKNKTYDDQFEPSIIDVYKGTKSIKIND